VVELRAVVHCVPGRDLERSHVVGGVDAGHVDRQRGQPALAPGLLRHREVAVPRLVHRAGERDVEADLDDLVVGAEHLGRDVDDPRVGREVGEAADLLGVHLDVPALRPAADGAALARAPPRTPP
jgi:hypothetical protein